MMKHKDLKQQKMGKEEQEWKKKNIIVISTSKSIRTIRETVKLAFVINLNNTE